MSVLAEQNIIGSLLIDGECISKIYNILEPQMFSSALFGRVYLEFQRCFDRGVKFNLPEFEQKLRSEDYETDVFMDEVRKCYDKTFSSADIVNDAKVILNDYKANRLNKFLNDMKLSPSNIQEQIRAISEELEVLNGNKETKSETLSEITKKYKGCYFREREVKPLQLGFSKLDNLLCGLEGGDLIIIGARPAVGKSAFVTQITSNLGKQKKRIGFFNLEMSSQQMYERFVVSESGISLTRLKRAIRFLGDEKQKFDKANEVLESEENIVITSTGMKSVSDIKAESKHMNYDIIIIDYLQLLKADTTYRGNRTAEVGEISRALKNLAMELNIPVIALSQLNRCSEGRDDKEPTMSELREAGNIEQDASVIILMWNLNKDDKAKKGCKIEKNRQGELGKVVMNFNGEFMRFEETDEDIKIASKVEPAEFNPFD